MNPLLTLYCNCFQSNLNRYSQANQKNLLCGASDLDTATKNRLVLNNFYFDDTGNNISSMNRWLGDLTGLYWVWKNTKDEFVGTNQYRRYYDDTELSNLIYDDKTLYASVWKKLLDLGDIIGIEGYVFTTKVGEISIHVTTFKLLSKSLICKVKFSSSI